MSGNDTIYTSFWYLIIYFMPYKLNDSKSLSYYHLYAYEVTFNVCTAYVNIIKRLSHKRISYYTFKREYWICMVLEFSQPWINKRKWNLQDLSIKGHFAYKLSKSDWRHSKLFLKLNQTINYLDYYNQKRPVLDL